MRCCRIGRLPWCVLRAADGDSLVALMPEDLELVVGRDPPECDLPPSVRFYAAVVSQPTRVSRKHCLICRSLTHTDGKTILVDLGRNGTSVNGQPVPQRELPPPLTPAAASVVEAAAAADAVRLKQPARSRQQRWTELQDGDEVSLPGDCPVFTVSLS